VRRPPRHAPRGDHRHDDAQHVQPVWLPCESKLSVLAALHRSGELTARQIADLERLQPQSLTRTLHALESAGLVRRRPDPDDRRRARLAITAKGTDALALEMADRDAWLAAALAEHATPAERGVLALAAELMERLAATE
jgi:DNA-binding MarR family transcriptional regulator